MLLRAADLSTDLALINDWLKKRQMEPMEESDIPANGFTVMLGDDAVACGFIRLCEGNVGWVDGLITNPEMPGQIRHQALDLLLVNLVNAARDIKLKLLIGHSVDMSTLERAKRHGFVQLPQTVVSKSLVPSSRACH